MMIETRNIHSMTDFLRNHRRHVHRLKKTGKPEVLTIQGKAEIVMMDAEAFQKMIEKREYEQTVAALQKGLDAVKRRQYKPALEAMRELHTTYGLPEIPLSE